MKNLAFVLLLVLLFSASSLTAQVVTVDDFSDDCRLTGTWADNRSNRFSDAGTFNRGYHYTSSHDPFKRTGRETAIWTPDLPKDGTYKVEVSFRAGTNRSPKVTYEVTGREGTRRIVVNQKEGDQMKWVTLGTFPFSKGKTGKVTLVSDGGQSASADAARFTLTDEAPGGLDDVLGGTPTGAEPPTGGGPAGKPAGAGVTLRVDKGGPGPKTFTFPTDGSVKITADLSTWGPAGLKAVRTSSGGGSEVLLSWTRRHDTDPSPLICQGKPLAGSMQNRGGGDFSPIATTRTFAGKKGDTITLTFSGNPGKADPFLELVASEGNPAAGVPAGSGPSDGSAPADGTGGASSRPGTEVEAGGSVTTSIPFDKGWTLQYEGRVGDTQGFARLMAGGGETVHQRRIDLWTFNGRGLHFRLANKRIRFTTAAVGEINNPDSSADHFLKTTVDDPRGTFRLQIRYLPADNRVQIHWNDELVGDATFRVEDLPRPQTSLDFPCTSGKIAIVVDE